MIDLTIERCMHNMDDLHHLATTGATDEIRNDAAMWLHTNKIIYCLLVEKPAMLPVATAYEDIDISEALRIDGTWWRLGEQKELQALDEQDLYWYEVEVICEDADHTLYFMDIRTQLLGGPNHV